jgi:hypothetical protein
VDRLFARVAKVGCSGRCCAHAALLLGYDINNQSKVSKNVALYFKIVDTGTRPWDRDIHHSRSLVAQGSLYSKCSADLFAVCFSSTHLKLFKIFIYLPKLLNLF